MTIGRPRTIPRAALLSLLIGMASHVVATFHALRTVQPIPAWHWAVLLCADLALFMVVIRRADWFLTRNFRLPGIFVLTTGIIILAPLPAAVRRYGTAVPHQTVLSIAVGLAFFSLVVFVLTVGAAPNRTEPASPSESTVAWVIVALGILVFPIWIRALGSVPLLQLFTHPDALTAAGNRNKALDSLSNAPLRAAVGILRNLYLMFAAGYLVSRAASASRRNWRAHTWRRMVAMGVLGLAGLYALLTTERAILGELVIVAVVAFLITRRRDLTASSMATSAVIGGSFPVLYALAVGSDLSAALTGLKRRILFLPDDVMLHYFIEFPRFHAFLNGSSVPKWGRLTGSPTFDLSSLIYDRYYKVSESLTGLANGSFLGVGWANWGAVGVVVWCGVAAAAIVMLERLLARTSRASGAALRGVAVVQVALLTSSDLSRSVLGFLPGILDLVFLIFVARTIDRRFHRVPPNRHVPALLSGSASA